MLNILDYRAIKTKYSNMPEALRSGIWFTICFIFQRGIQFIGIPIFTRLMSQKEYGIYSSFNSWVHIIVIISSLSIYSGVFNKALIKYDGEKEQYVSSIQSLTLVSSTIIGFVIVVFRSYFSKLMNLNEKCLYLIVIFIITFPAIQYWSQRRRFSFDYRSIIAITLIETLLTLGLGIMLVIITDSNKGVALIKASVIVQAGISFVLYVILMLRGRCVYKKEFWIWSIGMAIPLLPHYLSEIILGHADRVMINTMCGSDKAAIYNIAYQISMVMTIIRTGLNGAFFPWEFKMIRSKDYDSLRTTTNAYAIVMATMTIVCMLIGPELLMLAAPPTYREAVYIIPPLMTGCFYFFEYVLFANVELYYEKKYYITIASVLSATLNLILNWYCINRWGYLSAGYTTAISYLTMFGLHYYFYRKIERNNMEIREYYNIRILALLMIIVTLSSAISLVLYMSFFVRYIVITILLIVGYLNRKTLIGIFRRLSQYKTQ